MLEETGIHRKRRIPQWGSKGCLTVAWLKEGGLVFWGGKRHVLKPHS